LSHGSPKSDCEDVGGSGVGGGVSGRGNGDDGGDCGSSNSPTGGVASDADASSGDGGEDFNSPVKSTSRNSSKETPSNTFA
jgi:hypothetical protein